MSLSEMNFKLQGLYKVASSSNKVVSIGVVVFMPAIRVWSTNDGWKPAPLPGNVSTGPFAVGYSYPVPSSTSSTLFSLAQISTIIKTSVIFPHFTLYFHNTLNNYFFIH